ncbi:MAG: biotin--[acetyl-CoA-carboxylase] ligase [Elusimicrobia bacterium]|nr:biotin--[acetyl-CoA-carboxylase] ligase [Elusimicrobiota bacterium]
MKDALLFQLKGAKAPLSGTILADGLGVTRAAVHKRIQKLRTAGHQIVGTNRVGYRWAGTTVSLNPEALKGGIVTEVFRFPVMGSTQDEAKALAVKGAGEGTLVMADRQSAGRGRLGRSWVSPIGGLWYSLILRPVLPPHRVPALTLVAALDWVEVLTARGVPAGVKWPNDVWAEGKKMAGILTEMSAETDRVQWVALGVGVNVNNRLPKSPAVPAAAVSSWTGPIALEKLLLEWVGRFSKSYPRFVRSGFASFRSNYEQVSVLRGTRVSFEGPEGRNAGRVLGVDNEGRLRVSTATGETTCSAGEVSLLRPLELKSAPGKGHEIP